MKRHLQAFAGSLFPNFIDAVPTGTIADTGIGIRFSSRTHSSLMLNADSGIGQTPIPWTDTRSPSARVSLSRGPENGLGNGVGD